jgi:signal transduction histidine kinase
MVVREFELMASRRQQTIVLNTAVAPVSGDLDDLGVLVRNLIDNAIRYSGEGGRVVVACGRSADGTGVELTVTDNGPGVPREERAQIFDRFFRGSNGNGERGSGIGLSLVRRIAQAYGAEVTLDDGLDGRGLSIRVRFPDPER